MELKIFAKKNELPNAFEKGPQKWSLLNLSKRDNIISMTFFDTFLQQSLKISLLLFADLLKAAFPIELRILKSK